MVNFPDCLIMKIVKFFDDFEFYDKTYEPLNGVPNNPFRDYWRWGLGDDGELYWQCSDNIDPNKWYWFGTDGTSGGIARRLSLRDMKKIVKEFGHLLVFI